MDERSYMPLRLRLFRYLGRHWFWTAVVFLALWAGLFFILGQYSVYRAYPGLTAAQQESRILANVGKLIQLPSGEVPTMATIKNASAAKKAQPFLGNAQNGDIIIIYPQAAEALLYRPSTDKLIAVGPVNSPTQPPAIQPRTATSTPHGTATSTKKK